jgi:hypothetical protein
MAAVVAVWNNRLSIYVDHNDNMRGYYNEGVFNVPSRQQTGSTEQGVKKQLKAKMAQLRKLQAHNKGKKKLHR